MKTTSHPENERPSAPPQDSPRQHSVLWVGLVLLVSGWMFFLGVLVGRGTAPALFDYQRIESEITALAKSYTDSRKALNDMATDILKTPADLDYPEELKKKITDPATLQLAAPEKPTRPAEMSKPVQQEAVQVPTPSPVKMEFETVAKPELSETPPDPVKTGPEPRIKSMYDIKSSPVRETGSAAPERTAPAVPKPPPPAVENKTETAQPLAVHLSSVMDKKSADTLIESLRSKGISASKTAKMLPGKGIWYTVVIGKYSSSSEADAMMNRLRQENLDASVVKP